jgi:uncharacterized phage protein (TIGR02218 family)
VGAVIADPTAPTAAAVSGATEPVWPTTEYATVVDNGVTWTAIYARVTTGVAGSVMNQTTFQHNLNEYPNHYFQYGKITWLTGENKGYSCDVRDSLGVSAGIPYVMMLEIMPNEIRPGDTFQLTVGCAKRRLDCQNFNNLDNYRAFPDMPTEDRALATPNISAQGYAPSQQK